MHALKFILNARNPHPPKLRAGNGSFSFQEKVWRAALKIRRRPHGGIFSEVRIWSRSAEGAREAATLRVVLDETRSLGNTLRQAIDGEGSVRDR